MTLMNINKDGVLDIATGKTRKETTWKNRRMPWSGLLKRLSTTHRTHETHAEYLAHDKTTQDKLKDVGGFVGGYLDKGKRTKTTVVHRSLITLDLDFATAGMWDDFTMIYDNAAAVYSTHKHSPEKPRLRLVMPINREVLPDEYIAIARRIAGNIGINQFDSTGFQPERLMYWPSTPKDGEFIFEFQDGPFIDADQVLGSYRDWRDASEWPMSDLEREIPLREIKKQKQKDPLCKNNIVGTFCRTYDIHDTIEKFLEDVYDKCADDRYTFRGGSTAGGLVIYEDKFAYSHHGTDPVSGNTCNAFDLVRLHKFGHLDENVLPKTPAHKYPSFIAMADFVSQDPKVRIQITNEKIAGAENDFSEPISSSSSSNGDAWKAGLKCDSKNNIASTINNCLLIIINDEELKDCLAYDDFQHTEIVKKDLPWRTVTEETRRFTDRDESALRHFIENKYQVSVGPKLTDALNRLMLEKSFHPVKQYLNSLKWDGITRAEKLFIDYLGASDNDYTRAVAKKWLVAAVSRIFSPGCKFDYMPILIGDQGQKKSMLADKLGGRWFSDSFTTMQGKESLEQLQGVWIVEVAELAAWRQAEVESIKHFVSKRRDRYRVAYGRRTEDFPRQCVFLGTSNKRNPLKDPTGGRRFWPVTTYDKQPTKDIYEDLTEYEIGQIWGEAVALYKANEPLYLSPELEKFASDMQEEHSEQDEWTGTIVQYLNTLLPQDWDELNDPWKRWKWLVDAKDPDAIQDRGVKQRDRVCVMEIWRECFGEKDKSLNKAEAMRLHNIMRSLKDWEPYKSTIDKTGRTSFGIYGNQRGYRRLKRQPKNTVTKKSNVGHGSKGSNGSENGKATLPLLPINDEVLGYS